ncbi:MAG: carboxypeptidase-like regulatory domain-containing protein [Crocinitomicaceae bacterium]|nr:carboxypeptidase-like regulatory domain-containing protein [Crocinitomicaceae bacterium]
MRYFALILVILSSLQISSAFGQTEGVGKNGERDSLYYQGLVQFSGVVVSSDSLQPVPFANIFDRTTRRGTVSDYYGYFSFVAGYGDTIMFSFVGYKKSYFIIPDSLTDSRYSIIHMMEKDTVLLKETRVYPWPSKEEFADAFLNMDTKMDDLSKARQNLSGDNMAFASARLPSEGSMTYKWEQQQFQTRIYTNGQAPSINILNPIAWGQFIDYWRKGKFKDKNK